MTYLEKLQDYRWAVKRFKILVRDSFTCQRCFDDDCILQVHHLLYYGNRDPWDYDDDDLITLCIFCHKAVGIVTEEEEIRNPWLQYEREKKEISLLLSVGDYVETIKFLTNRLCL